MFFVWGGWKVYDCVMAGGEFTFAEKSCSLGSGS